MSPRYDEGVQDESVKLDRLTLRFRESAQVRRAAAGSGRGIRLSLMGSKAGRRSSNANEGRW